MIYYAIYDESDYCVCVGDIKECSEYLKVAYSTFCSYISRMKDNCNKNSKYAIYKFIENYEENYEKETVQFI